MSKTHGQLAAEALLGEVVWESEYKGRCECPANHKHGRTDGIKNPAIVQIRPVKIICPHKQCMKDASYITRDVQGILSRKIKELAFMRDSIPAEAITNAVVPVLVVLVLPDRRRKNIPKSSGMHVTTTEPYTEEEPKSGKRRNKNYEY